MTMLTLTLMMIYFDHFSGKFNDLPVIIMIIIINDYSRQNDSLPFVLHCTCGGIGDPFSIILNKVIIIVIIILNKVIIIAVIIFMCSIIIIFIILNKVNNIVIIIFTLLSSSSSSQSSLSPHQLRHHHHHHHHLSSSLLPPQGPKPELGVPYYGTRFGHNLVHQIKQKMVDLNITKVIKIVMMVVMVVMIVMMMITTWFTRSNKIWQISLLQR